MKALRPFLSLLCLLAIASPILSGCTALTKLSTFLQPSANPISQAAIDLGVGLAVGTDPLTQKAKAVAIKAIAEQILADSSKVTVTALEAEVNAKVTALAPNPLDLAAFMVLTQSLQGFLNTELAKTPVGAITTSTQVAIGGLAQAVITACDLLGA